MILKILTPKTIEQMAEMVRASTEILPVGSQTSTVVPFQKQAALALAGIRCLLDTSCLEKSIQLEGENVLVRGAVSWAELREYLNTKNLEIGCWPTDQTALVLSGLATSATGERCFSRGALRDHVQWLEYMDGSGEINRLSSSNKIEEVSEKYHLNLAKYEGFKNTPYPRFEKETDLCIGLEGQLGVITAASLKTFPLEKCSFILIPKKSWLEVGFDLSLVAKAREHKDKILSFEFVDSNSIKISKDEVISCENDLYIFEVIQEHLEAVVGLLGDYDFNIEDALVMDEKKFYDFRVSIPRAVNEFIALNGLIKMGTDTQSSLEDFERLVSIYQDLAQKGQDYVLFGHLGDCHLHFNFMPKAQDKELCEDYLAAFYQEIKNLNVTPFAEHGIGIVKQKFMSLFYNEAVKSVFEKIKKKYDSENKFFPQGFLNFYKR